MLLVVLLPALCLLPFVNKAYNIDDPLFVWGARQIVAHPLDFFGFEANWGGVTAPMYKLSQNPPGVSYFIAPVYALFGDSEIAIHLFLLLPVVALGWATYLLGNQLAVSPVLATLCAMVTPLVFVSGMTVMSDMLMAALFAWAIHLWIRGLERQKWWLLGLSMVCVTGSFLSKYFGLTCLGVLLAYTVARERRASWRLLWLVVPVVMAALYDCYTRHRYGTGMLYEAWAFNRHCTAIAGNKMNFLARLLVGSSFAGGCCITLLFFASRLCSRIACVLLAVAAAGGVTLFHFARWQRPGSLCQAEGPLFYVEWVVFTFAGLLLLYLVGQELVRRRDPGAVLLAVWISGTFAYSAFVNWSVNARTLLPMGPAVGLLIARTLRRGLPEGAFNWRVWAPLASAAAVSFAALWGDYAWANATRGYVQDIWPELRQTQRPVRYLGHWALQYYLDKAGAAAVEVRGPAPDEPVIIVAARHNCNDGLLPPDARRLSFSREFPASRWACTMNFDAGAGFYNDQWGPLPYFIGPTPKEAVVAALFDPSAQ